VKDEATINKTDSKWLMIALVLLIVVGVGAIVSGVILMRRKRTKDVQ